MYKVICAAIVSVLIILLLINLYIKFQNKYDYYLPNIGGYWDYDPDYKYYYKDPLYYTHPGYPENSFIWNAPLRSTRNMSYDLRGDVSINEKAWLPFNWSSWIPIRNKPLYAIS